MTVHASDQGHLNGTGSLIGLVENAYVVDLVITGGLSRQNVDAEYIIDTSITTVDDAWWTTNLANITGSDLWTFNAVSSFYELS